MMSTKNKSLLLAVILLFCNSLNSTSSTLLLTKAKYNHEPSNNNSSIEQNEKESCLINRILGEIIENIREHCSKSNKSEQPKEVFIKKLNFNLSNLKSNEFIANEVDKKAKNQKIEMIDKYIIGLNGIISYIIRFPQDKPFIIESIDEIRSNTEYSCNQARFDQLIGYIEHLNSNIGIEQPQQYQDFEPVEQVELQLAQQKKPKKNQKLNNSRIKESVIITKEPDTLRYSNQTKSRSLEPQAQAQAQLQPQPQPQLIVVGGYKPNKKQLSNYQAISSNLPKKRWSNPKKFYMLIVLIVCSLSLYVACEFFTGNNLKDEYQNELK